MKSLQFQTRKSWPLTLGIDIGTHSLKYLLLSQKQWGIKVEAFGRYSLVSEAEDAPEKIQEIINHLFQKSNDFKRAKVIVGLEGSNVVVKRESLPELKKKELIQTISFGIHRELAKENEDAVVVCDAVSIAPSAETPGNYDYLTIGALEEEIDMRVGPIVSSGLIPAKVVPVVLSFTNLYQYLSEVEKMQLFGVLDIGADRSMLVLIKNGELAFFREIVVGGDDFTKAITGTIFHEGKAIQFTNIEASEFKIRYGYPLGFSEGMTFRGAPLSEVGTMMRPVVERLTGEIQRSLGFYRDQSGSDELHNLYLVGGGARLKHLPNVLADKIGCSVSLLTPPEKIKVGGKKEQRKIFNRKFAEQAVSLSLALESPTGGNLLPLIYKKINRNNFIQKLALAGIFTILILIAFMSINIYTKKKDLQRSVKEKERMVPINNKRIAMYEELQSEKVSLESQISAINELTKQDENILQIIRLVTHATPPYIALTSLKYGMGTTASGNNRSRRAKNQNDQSAEKKWMLRLEGVNKDPPNDYGIFVAQFIVNLEESGYFSEVKLERESFNNEKKTYTFSIVAYIDKKE